MNEGLPVGERAALSSPCRHTRADIHTRTQEGCGFDPRPLHDSYTCTRQGVLREPGGPTVGRILSCAPRRHTSSNTDAASCDLHASLTLSSSVASSWCWSTCSRCRHTAVAQQWPSLRLSLKLMLVSLMVLGHETRLDGFNFQLEFR